MTPEEKAALLLDTMVKVANEGGRIVKKEGWFWTALHYIVMIVTFGGNRRFLRDYYTTIGPWIGVPRDWNQQNIESRIAILEHELEHIKQCKRCGFGNAIVGLPLYTLLYLLLPLPFGLAYFRWRFERTAYVKGIEARLKLTEPDLYVPTRLRLIDNAVDQLTSGKYGWTWPFPKSVREYFGRMVFPYPPAKYDASGLIARDVQ